MMNWKRLTARIGIGLGILVAIGALLTWLPSRNRGAAQGDDTWTCSMHPQIRLPNPGRCPICGMQLIPVSKLPKARDDLQTRAGLVTEAVGRRELFKEIRAVGKLDFSERQVAYIASRVEGRVDRLFVDFTGIEVKTGDHLVEIYSPELLVAQNELLLGLEARGKEVPLSTGLKSFAQTQIDAARTKLRLLGILDEQINQIETSRKPTTHLTIYAPIGGTVVEKNVRVGQYVNTGDALFRIADLDPIWLYLNIYEFDLAWVRFGQKVDVQLEAFPGENFTGSIMFIDPFLDDATRSVRVRVNIKNPARLLKPQMFATATIRVRLRSDGSPEATGLEGLYVCPMHPEIVERGPGKCSICAMPLVQVPPVPAKSSQRAPSDAPENLGEQPANPPQGVLAIPVSSVLDTGRRRIAYRLAKNGAYELVELTLGPRAQARDEAGKFRDYFVVLGGVEAGQQVVSQGSFLLDSQRQIEGMPSLLYPGGQTGASLHAGHGAMDGTPAPPSTQSAPAGHRH